MTTHWMTAHGRMRLQCWRRHSRRILMKRVARRWPALLVACVIFTSGLAFPQAGVPVPEDSPVFNAFRQLDKQTAGYRMKMNMTVNDPRMAQMAAGMGFGGLEKIVKGNTIQTDMHWKMPAMDLGGRSMDDWEAKAVFVN